MKPTAKCNPDLAKERENCQFNKEEITNLIDGGVKETQQRRELETYILSDPELRDPIPTEYLSHEERYTAELRKACLLVKKARNSPCGQVETLQGVLGAGIGSAIMKEGNPLALHYVMFIPSLMGQASSDQQMKWLQRAYNCEILGTYAQTELGHGTHLRGLETIATYDPKTKEFVLETPSLSAYKWWPGSLGKTANYAVVMAQLYTKGQCHGIHGFIVQLRDEQTHEPLPGIDIGEIGPKLGLNTNDNGYLGFNKFRIPRENMLMRHAQVLEDGTYVKPASDKLSYGTMVFVRVVICRDVTAQLQKAVTIAVRYSAVRRQSELKPGDREPQIIDFQTQQSKLFPALASVFAFRFTAQYMWDVYNAVSSSMEQGDLELLPELHALSCGMKAICSAEAALHVETLRRSCGGHGYMTCSNFPRIYSQVTAAETYEGENTVLYLQVARYLVKAFREKSGGKSVTYLKNYKPSEPSRRIDLSLPGMVRLFQQVAGGLVANAVEAIDKRGRNGEAPHEAWNNCAVILVRAAQAHCRYFMADRFVQVIMNKEMSGPVRSVLSQLCELLLLYWILDAKGDFVLDASLTKDDVKMLQTKYGDLLGVIRPNAVNLVDSFDVRDEVINSALGAWDGFVYERLFEETKKSPLNRTAVHHSSFHQYIKPFLKSSL